MADFNTDTGVNDFTYFEVDGEQVGEAVSETWTELNGTHRCDQEAKGQARACVVVASKETGREIMLCKNHFERNSAALAAKGFIVLLDEREKLEAKEQGVHA